MKSNIHPQYSDTQYECSCGAKFTIPSTINQVVKLEVCYQCHPLYTGKEKVVDTEGRIERFNRKYKR